MFNLPSRDDCPRSVAETAEAYYMRKLPPAEAKHFGEHYPKCSRCSSALEKAGTFVAAMHAALKMLNIGVCPPDVAETAEAYCMRKLPPAEAYSFGEHYPTCQRCSSALEHALRNSLAVSQLP